MANNTSNFRNDFNAEKVINEFLRKYFYQKIVDKNIIKAFRHITDSNLQHEGVDTIIITLRDVAVHIDEKAALDYAKNDLAETALPTFAFEISYLNRDGVLTEGWLTNSKYRKTEDYLLIWLWVKPDTKMKWLRCEDILQLEIIVLAKKDILDTILYYASGDSCLTRFRQIASKQREFMLAKNLQQVAIEKTISNVDLHLNEYSMENFMSKQIKSPIMKWYLTDISRKAEQPLNIVVHKKILKELAKSCWIITPNNCIRKK